MPENNLPELLIISSYPPRECGIATYSQDLIHALQTQFNQAFKMTVCALENDSERHKYTDNVQYVLDTSDAVSYDTIARFINGNTAIKLVLLQHEFGFFVNHKASLLHLIETINVPVVVTFHTVLPSPNRELLFHIQHLAAAAQSITVMTRSAALILQKEYAIDPHKITVIAHGTHLVKYAQTNLLKEKYGFSGRTVLSTFGLISSGKSIETTLRALPAIVEKHPDVLFLVIGKTHPVVVKHEGEQYRQSLEAIVFELNIESHVQFVNYYLPLPTLLEYLQLTDIYLFTSKDPHQAVSGTFSYAISCGCPIISTPIPHAREVLQQDAGILIDFESVSQLEQAVNRLLDDKSMGEEMRLKGLHRIVFTAWENTAIAHALLFEKYANGSIELSYSMPKINLEHIHQLTTDFGMIQFSKINQPDLESGYTIDDNARAMIAMCMQYERTRADVDLEFIRVYLSFIQFCIQANGRFLNYVDSEQRFTPQNKENNLDDANGRVIWALGYLINLKDILPADMVGAAIQLMDKALSDVVSVHSTRAIAFTLKGLFYYDANLPNPKNKALASTLAHRLERMFAHESELGWDWFESYLTYANGVLPEGMLCAYQITGEELFKHVSQKSFDFLLANTFSPSTIKLISNQGWRYKGGIAAVFGEQPIDVAYTILALSRFYDVFDNDTYLQKMAIAFTWFLGNNHLHQIIYNPCTGGCYDGLEENHVNLNQGAESSISYLLSRLTVEKYQAQYELNEERMSEQSYW
jgi:glycosyltransferase involved in cell wall biosynthesis